MDEDEARIRADAEQLRAAYQAGLVGKPCPKNGDRDMQRAWEVGAWLNDLALAEQQRVSGSRAP